MFAEIENCMKLALGKRQNTRFMDIAREYVQVYNLPSSYLVSLQTYAALRNAIDHNSHRGAYPIAEPIPEIVVFSIHSGELVSVALEYVRQFDFSQLPVYESGQYVGILMTNTIARWLAQQIVEGGEHQDVAIGEVMEFREPSDRALLVDRTLTAADAIHQLAYGSPDAGPVNALILTENKLPTDRPIRVIAVYDVPLLSAALKFS